MSNLYVLLAQIGVNVFHCTLSFTKNTYFPFVVVGDRAQRFGWVGEWARTRSVYQCALDLLNDKMLDSLEWYLVVFVLFPLNSNEFRKKSSTAINNPICIQTLYYADKEKTDEYILKLVTLLHRVISLTRHRDHAFRPLPLQSPNRTALDFTPRCSISYPWTAVLKHMDFNFVRKIEIS